MIVLPSRTPGVATRQRTSPRAGAARMASPAVLSSLARPSLPRRTPHLHLNALPRGHLTALPECGSSPIRALRARGRSVAAMATSSGEEAQPAVGTVEGSEVIFIGSGTSEGVPRVSCLTSATPICPVCTDAIIPGSKNRRRNTSIMVRYQGRNILIDAGKFFYHSALEVLVPNKIRAIDAVVITHSHADAIGGLDDLRDWTNNVPECPHIPVYVAERDYKVMEKTHYYMMPKGKEQLVKGTAVSSISFELMPPGYAPFSVEGLEITPLPVWHGEGYLSLGFRFGDVCYISDVSSIPEETFQLMGGCGLLIIDALRPDRSSASHFGLPESLENVKRIRPKRVLFTGMMHTMDHEAVDGMLRGGVEGLEGVELGLSYDGLRVPVDL